jgi:hypothetical protein
VFIKITDLDPAPFLGLKWAKPYLKITTSNYCLLQVYQTSTGREFYLVGLRPLALEQHFEMSAAPLIVAAHLGQCI